MKKIILGLLLFIGLQLSAQYYNNYTEFGDEWINFNQEYYKFELDSDGLYRITKEELESLGFPVSSVPMNQFQLFHLGIETYIHTSTEGIMNDGDYIEFFGKRNRNELDKWTFENQEDQMNPDYSMITDTSAYFLTYNPDKHLRVTNYSNNISGSLNPEKYYLNKIQETYNSDYFKAFNNELRTSDGYILEGFSSPFFNSKNVTLYPTNISVEGPDPRLTARIGFNNNNHKVLLTSNNQTIYEHSGRGYNLLDLDVKLNNDLITNNEFKLKMTGTAGTSDKFRFSHVSLTYASEFKFNQEEFKLFEPFENEKAKFVSMQNFTVNSESVIVWDIANNNRVIPVQKEELVDFELPQGLIPQQILVFKESAIKKVNSGRKVNFVDYSAMNAQYLILSDKKLTDSSLDGKNWIEEYSNYRASELGGGYSTKVIYVSDIYDQFSYGVNGHYLAINSFVARISSLWSDLDFILILGTSRESVLFRSPQEQEKLAENVFIPTFGYPGSDNMLISSPFQSEPNKKFGRIAASSPQDIKNYLNKIMTHENTLQNPSSVDKSDWMKNIVHLAGGDAKIRDNIRYYLDEMSEVVSNSKIGANVFTVDKKTTDPLEFSQSELIRKKINDGVSVLTFFGHSSVVVFDLNLEDVNSYDNKDRYPVILGLGCHSGNIHSTTTGISKSWVLAENKGSLGYLASSSTALLGIQRYLGNDFYNLLGNELYGSTMGEIVKKLISTRNESRNIGWRTLMQQLTYHGDPALRIAYIETPDYAPLYESVSLNPTSINIDQNSFDICFDIVNYGRHVDDSLEIEIKHIGTEHYEKSETIKIVSPSQKDRVCHRMGIDKKSAELGKNAIKIVVDPNNKIDEKPSDYAESNNSLSSSSGETQFDFFLLSSSARVVSPLNFAIYTEQEVNLYASTDNAFSDRSDFIIQVDSSINFDSPLFREETITDQRGLIKWTPDASIFEYDQVYYWRITKAGDEDSRRTWDSGSFIYRPNDNEGWNQSKKEQINQNELDNLIYSGDRLSFVKSSESIRIKNFISQPGNPSKLWISGSPTNTTFAIAHGPLFGVFIFNPYKRIRGSGEWNKQPNSYLPYPKWSQSFYFHMDTQEGRIGLMNFLNNYINEDDFVFVYTSLPKFDRPLDYKTEDWASDSLANNGKNIFTTMKSLGATDFDFFRNNTIRPYSFCFKKGKGKLAEDRAEEVSGVSEITVDAFIYWQSGSINTLVGPASSWDRIEWSNDLSSLDSEQDSSSISIILVDHDGNEEVYAEGIKDNKVDISNISADMYPFIKLKYYSEDKTNRTPTQFNNWKVYFDGLSEIALNSNNPQTVVNKDTLSQGEKLEVNIPLYNISDKDIKDSIDVKLVVQDANNNSIVELSKSEPIKANSQTFWNTDFSTANLTGDYRYTIQVNSSKDPAENHYFNNFAIGEFSVLKDNENPLLDVSFDGQRILDGDLVASKPTIRIEVKDENPFLLLNDSSSYFISITAPSGLITQYPINDPQVQFIPATNSNNNKSVIIVTPTFTEDGEYMMEVQARDRAGNKAGKVNYKIHFNVILEQMISNVFNYPNPFSDCTQFIFTLTGQEVPTDLRIRIMTVTGIVVKEIHADELGPLHVGVNKTSYRWCGNDEYNWPLANGVYLYQVITKDAEGEEYKKYDTKTDKFFKKNIGKMVILR